MWQKTRDGYSGQGGRFRGFGPEFRSGAGTVRRAGSVVRPGNSRHGARLSAAPIKNQGRAMYLSRMRSGVGMLAEAGADEMFPGEAAPGRSPGRAFIPEKAEESIQKVRELSGSFRDRGPDVVEVGPVFQAG